MGFIDRITGEEVPLVPRRLRRPVSVHLYDWLEQLPRSREWDYRRPAYRRMAERLGKPAEESFERVYAESN